MDVLTAVKERRAVKHYDPEFEIPKEDISKLLEHAIESPTSFNIQNWRFVLVEDKEQREKLQEAAWGQEQVTKASLVFVMCADLKAWAKEPQRYWKNAPQEAQDMLIPMIMPFYEGKEWQQRDEAMRSVGIAAQTIMLCAKEMGYDSCPMIGFDPEKVAELINLPEDHVICMMLVVGKATKQAWPKPGQLELEEVLIKNTF